MRPCEKCDFIGPELPTLVRDERALHRAMHDAAEAFAVACDSTTDHLLALLERAVEAFTSPSITLRHGKPRRKWRRR